MLRVLRSVRRLRETVGLHFSRGVRRLQGPREEPREGFVGHAKTCRRATPRGEEARERLPKTLDEHPGAARTDYRNRSEARAICQDLPRRRFAKMALAGDVAPLRSSLRGEIVRARGCVMAADGRRAERSKGPWPEVVPPQGRA